MGEAWSAHSHCLTLYEASGALAKHCGFQEPTVTWQAPQEIRETEIDNNTKDFFPLDN